MGAVDSHTDAALERSDRLNEPQEDEAMPEGKIVMCRVEYRRDRYISLFALVVALLTAGPSSAQTVPLQASDAQVTDRGNLEYLLTSFAAQPATAWSVTVVVTDPHGTLIRQSAITVDEYRADAQRGFVSGDQLAHSLLRPGQPRRFELPGPFDSRLLVTVTPAAMVFLDRTSVGDPLMIASIFDRRAEERDARAEMLRQLVDVRARYAGPAALKEAMKRLSRPVTPDPGHARELCEKNLREALARSEAADTDPVVELSRQIEMVRREYDAAVRHAVAHKEE